MGSRAVTSQTRPRGNCCWHRDPCVHAGFPLAPNIPAWPSPPFGNYADGVSGNPPRMCDNFGCLNWALTKMAKVNLALLQTPAVRSAFQSRQGTGLSESPGNRRKPGSDLLSLEAAAGHLLYFCLFY